MDVVFWIIALVCFGLAFLQSVMERPFVGRLDLISLGLFFGALTFVV